MQLAPGTYDLSNRLVLDRSQTLVGAGVSISYLSQAADARLVQYPKNPNDPNDPDYKTWNDFLLDDFIVGLSSDCASVKNLSILGYKLPDNLSSLSNIFRHFNLPTYYPNVSGIQISSHLQWNGTDPQIKNIQVQNVEVFRAHSACITIHSDRAAKDVVIDGLFCEARNSNSNTAGLTIEAFDPVYANKFVNITVKNSRFTGGMWNLYIAGVTNFILENSNVVGGPVAIAAAFFYTGDSGHPITASIRNSNFSLLNPTSSTRAVIELIGRDFLTGSAAYLRETESSITFDGGTVESAVYPATTLVPLVQDGIGFLRQVQFKSITFRGGSNAIFAGDPLLPSTFGATLYGVDISSDVDAYKVYHSNFFISQGLFYDQADSSIKINRGSIKLFDSTFYNIGRDPIALDHPIIDLGSPSPYNDPGAPENNFQNNAYSGVNATVFLRLPANVPLQNTLWGTTNYPFTTSESRPASSMDSIRLRP